MRIDQDKLLVNCSDNPDNKKSAPAVNSQVSGLRCGNEIYLSPNTAFDSIAVYCHEVGHMVGDVYSFQKVDETSGELAILSIDEVQEPDAIIELSAAERMFLFTSVHLGGKNTIDPSAITIANKLLTKFTKGKFDPATIELHTVSQHELTEKVQELVPNIPTLFKNSDGGLIPQNSKQGRDNEMPSHLTEYCCMQILENTLKKTKLFSSERRDVFTFGINQSPSHQRAKNIIARAFGGKGWRIPSMVDTNNR